MANTVSFIIELKNRFGKTAEKVKRQFEGIDRKVKKVNRSLRTMVTTLQSSAKKFAATAGKIGAALTVAVTTPIVIMGKKMLEAGSDANETANKFNTVFESVRGTANKVANDFSKNFGVAGSTARQMLGDTGDLLVGFGFSEKAALGMSKQVAELASDLTSFTNFADGAGAANVALTKALLGESESAKALGIVIRQGTDEFKNNVKALMQVGGVSLLQAKALEILRIAQSQSGKATGDVARTWEDYASVARRSEEDTKNLMEVFGKLMIPLATRAQKLWIGVVSALNELSPSMKKLILVVAGVVAIGGPLLLLIAGLSAAFAFLSLPVLIIGGAILGLITAGILLASNWDEVVAGGKLIWGDFASFISNLATKISGFFSSMWDGIKTGIKEAVLFGIGFLDKLTAPIRFILTSIANLTGIDLKFPSMAESVSARNPRARAPTTPTGVNGSVSGNIVVSATKGSEVKSTSLRGRGRGLNLGMNMGEASE